MLNLPDSFYYGRVLYLGCGGGWDFTGAIPIAETQGGLSVFANYSSHRDDFLLTSKNDDNFAGSHPEEFIAPYLSSELYVIGRHGVQLVRKAIQKIVDDHEITSLVLIDGGVDSLMRGDEIGSGTILEDFITLTAASRVNVENKFLCCLGLGTETENGVNHYRVLENISALMQTGGFVGSCALTNNMDCFNVYNDILTKAVSDGATASHIQTKVAEAVNGKFGEINLNYDSRLSYSMTDVFLNPLMSLYWFFELDKVVENNKFSTLLEQTNTFIDAKSAFRQNIDITNKRPHLNIPL